MTEHELDALCHVLWTVPPQELGTEHYNRLVNLANRSMKDLGWVYETWIDYHKQENLGIVPDDEGEEL